MEGIEAILPCVDEVEFFCMPEVRVIGKAIECILHDDHNPVPAFWGTVFADGSAAVLAGLPHSIPGSMVGWTGNTIAGTNTFTYIVGVFAPAGTPVPEGFDHRDLPASIVGKGLFGEDIPTTVHRLGELGYEPVYTELGWNAELYQDGDAGPAPATDDWRWLVPCRRRAGAQAAEGQ